MVSRKKKNVIVVLLMLLVLSGCTEWIDQFLPSPEPVDIPEYLEVQSDPIPIGSCPDVATPFQIYLVYNARLDVDPGGGAGSIVLTLESYPDAFIDIWVDEDGLITLEDEEAIINIEVTGYATYPGSNTCSKQQLDGIWDMKTELSGRCILNRAIIDIKHTYTWAGLISSCGEEPLTIQQTISAPEHKNLHFRLVQPFPAKVITTGLEGSYFQSKTTYFFERSDVLMIEELK